MRNAYFKAALAALTLSVACLAPAAQAQSKDPVIGTWKINAEKSKYDPGRPPKSLVTKFEPAGKGVKNTTEFVNAEGKAFTITYTAEYDGKDVPLAGSPTANAVAIKKLKDGSVERVDKKDGMVTSTMVRRVSKDGKTLTVTQKGTNPQGTPINNVMIFDRK
jgi:hypothetical protein